MTHLDEGTIHAWLDGALTDAEARTVSEHSASCAQCAALVAEARGLIAAASRILTSLDDVPAGITPKRAPVVASSRPARRYWQAAPWVTGIAAVLILAIGLKTWLANPSAKDAVVAVTPPQMDSLRAAPIADATTRSADSAPRVTRVSAPPMARVQPRPTTAAELAPAGPPLAAQGAGAKKAMVEESRPVSALADVRTANAVQLAGCYRLPVTAGRQDAVAEAMSRVAPAAATMAPQSVVRLDTGSTSSGRLIRSVTTGTAIGTWLAADGDSVRLVMFATGAATLPSSNRVPCPPVPPQ